VVGQGFTLVTATTTFSLLSHRKGELNGNEETRKENRIKESPEKSSQENRRQEVHKEKTPQASKADRLGGQQLTVHKTKHPAAHSRHPQKDRAYWFQRSAAFPLRDSSPVELEKFWASQVNADISPVHRWQCLGPNNIAGRVTALVIHPTKPNTWYAGSATGGLWVSDNAGESWRPTWSRFANQNIGALAWMHFQGTLTLIAATGEANMSGDSYPGSGIYFSDDEGLTWQPLFGDSPFAKAKATIEEDIRITPRRVGSFATNVGRLAMGSVFLDDSLPAGLYLCDVETGMGLTPCTAWGERSYNCHCVLIHPKDPDTIYVSIEPDGSHNGIWRSRDFGKSWERLSKGLPSGDQFRRTSLAFAPSDPNVMYALAANRRNHILGLFRSTNGGDSWREILGDRYPKERQMSYNNVIAVHPRNPDRVVWGGMKLYRTDDVGRHWRRIGSGDSDDRDYVHSDHHALIWLDDEVIISGNDGGVAITTNGGRTWQERTRGMVTTMFYDLAVAPSNCEVFGGGTQDNGTLIAGVDGVQQSDFAAPVPGDGAWLAFDPANAGNVFACASGFEVYYHHFDQPWKFDGWKHVKPSQITDDEAKQRAFTVMAIEPSTRRGPKSVWAGSNRLWRTDNNDKSWRPVSPSFDGTPISAIEISTVNPDLMYAGTTGGGIFRSKDRGCTWSQNLSSIDIPSRAITSIETHPTKAKTLVVTVASSGLLSSGVDIQTGKSLPYGHVFLSEDAGDTWTDIDAGALPNVVYYAAAYETNLPYRLFVGGDLGVWAYVGKQWLNISGNLPNVVVSDLVYHGTDRSLTAATYGRGIWRITPGELTATVAAQVSPEEISEVSAGLRVDPSVAAPVVVSPADGAVSASFTVIVTVQPVRGAMGYQVEFMDEKMSRAAGSKTTQIQFQPAVTRKPRWRVWAILPDGLRSRASAWRTITLPQ